MDLCQGSNSTTSKKLQDGHQKCRIKTEGFGAHGQNNEDVP